MIIYSKLKLKFDNFIEENSSFYMAAETMKTINKYSLMLIWLDESNFKIRRLNVKRIILVYISRVCIGLLTIKFAISSLYNEVRDFYCLHLYFIMKLVIK